MVDFGKFLKRSKRQVIRSNAERGKHSEGVVKRSREFMGWKVERTGKGHDFKATKRIL